MRVRLTISLVATRKFIDFRELQIMMKLSSVMTGKSRLGLIFRNLIFVSCLLLSTSKSMYV